MKVTYLLLLQTIREAFGGIFDGFMCDITTLAEVAVTFPVLAAVYWCVHKRTGRLMGYNVALACTFSQFLKAVCKVKRPWVRDGRIHPVAEAIPAAGGYSFPSGHTARAVAVYGSAGWAACKEKTYRALGVLQWILVALILFSRNYLGVHTLWDVAGALIIGMICIALLDRVLDWMEKGKQRDIAVCAAGCVLCFLPMLKVGCLTNAGAGMGIFIGCFVERRWIRFSVDGSPQTKCVRFVIGALLMLAIQKVVQPFLRLFMLPKYAGFFMYFTLTVFIMAIYPFFFSIWERKDIEKEKKRKRLCGGIVILAVLVMGMCIAAKIKTSPHADAGQGSEAQIDHDAADPGSEAQVDHDAADPGQHEQAGDDQFVPTKEEDVMAVIAHRGYSSEFPENTLISFAGALDIGVDYIETDVQRTKDGVLVLFHDTEITRITGMQGTISDYTYEELKEFDAGSWFGGAYAESRIPTLAQLLDLMQDSDCRLYLELKDIGEAAGFEEAVLDEVTEHNMLDRCVFASFRYPYLKHLKELNSDVKVLYNTSTAEVTMPQEFPADYYGLYINIASSEIVNAIHAAGGKAFVWTVNTPSEMLSVKALGMDGVVTNCPGLAKVVRYSAYQYVSENYVKSITMPGLYEPDLPEECRNMVVQGLTLTRGQIVVSAYSKSGQNSILYVTDLTGNLIKIVDTGTKAHMGGIAYDEKHDALWMTGEQGTVWAAQWTDMLEGSWQGEGICSFDAGLTNHNQSKVASFLGIDGDRLYVGSYVDGSQGKLNCYDISDMKNPRLLFAASIPQRIQGVTFWTDASTGTRYMMMSQGYQMEDSCLLKFEYRDEMEVYDEPVEQYRLPEGSEQILATEEGLYILFESAARPYRATSRIPNDQIYVIQY